MKTETVRIHARSRLLAEKFADMRYNESANKNIYNKRGAFKREDVVIGALAELGVHKYLKSIGLKSNKPDFTMHKQSKKSYGADITVGEKHFHVKGQSLNSTEKYGPSWLMQRRDPLVNDAVKKHYLVPCTVDLETNEVVIHGFFSFEYMHEYKDLVFGECVLESFRRTKIAIYLDNLDIVSNKARWAVSWKKAA